MRRLLAGVDAQVAGEPPAPEARPGDVMVEAFTWDLQATRGRWVATNPLARSAPCWVCWASYGECMGFVRMDARRRNAAFVWLGQHPSRLGSFRTVERAKEAVIRALMEAEIRGDRPLLY